MAGRALAGGRAGGRPGGRTFLRSGPSLPWPAAEGEWYDRGPMAIRAGIFDVFGGWGRRWRSRRRRGTPVGGGWSDVVEALKGEIGPDPRPRHIAWPAGR